MKRITMTLALLATSTLLSGCVFAVGSTHEAQPKDRLERLETRVRAVETQLGIPAQSADGTATPAPEVQK